MAITNLTNTTWVFNETLSSDVYRTYKISFTSAADDSTTYIAMTTNSSVDHFEVCYRKYDSSISPDWSTQVYWGMTGGWKEQTYRTITITDGDDVENVDLITFLQENARLEGSQEEPEEPEESIDLTNTTWVFKAKPTYALDQTFNIDFTSNNEIFTSLVASNWGACVIGYDETANAYNYTWSNEAYRTITITGGDDVKNADLIAFLKANTLPTPEFTEVKVPLKIYTDLTVEEYEVLKKEEDSFYLVDDVGIYKGNKLIAQTSAYPKRVYYNASECYFSEGGYYQCYFSEKLLNPNNSAIFLITITGIYGQNRLPILTNTTFEFNSCEVSGSGNGFTISKLVDGERGSFDGTEFSSFEVIILSEY